MQDTEVYLKAVGQAQALAELVSNVPVIPADPARSLELLERGRRLLSVVHIAQTPPMAAALLSSSGVRFAVIGDYGSAVQPELDVSNLVNSWNPDFFLSRAPAILLTRTPSPPATTGRR